TAPKNKNDNKGKNDKNNKNKKNTDKKNNKGKNNKNKGKGNGNGGGQNCKISCQPTNTVNITGSRKIRAIVRDKNNKLVDGRNVVWSITNNPGNWIARITKSSKTQKGIAT